MYGIAFTAESLRTLMTEKEANTIALVLLKGIGLYSTDIWQYFDQFYRPFTLWEVLDIQNPKNKKKVKKNPMLDSWSSIIVSDPLPII